jgi:hypothetical protein
MSEMDRHRLLCLVAIFVFALGTFAPAKATDLLVCRVTGHITLVLETPEMASSSIRLDDCCGEDKSPGIVRLIKASCCDLLPASLRENTSLALSSVKESITASFAVLVPAPLTAVLPIAVEAIPEAAFSVSTPPRAPPLPNSIGPRAPPSLFS